jgi:hypothetical protein
VAEGRWQVPATSCTGPYSSQRWMDPLYLSGEKRKRRGGKGGVPYCVMQPPPPRTGTASFDLGVLSCIGRGQTLPYNGLISAIIGHPTWAQSGDQSRAEEVIVSGEVCDRPWRWSRATDALPGRCHRMGRLGPRTAQVILIR